MKPLETPPPYVDCSPEKWEEAKASVARKQLTNFFVFAAPYRRCAMRAAMHSGWPIKPELAVEFRSTIDAIGYRPRALPRPNPEAEAKKRKAMDEYHEAQRKLREQPTGFVSTEQARAILGPWAFAHFFETPEGRALERRENAEAERKFHGG